MPNFSMVLTAAGAELLAKGVAGKTMQFTAIAVGDGTFSGSPVDATALQREVKRLPIQRMTRRKNTVSLRATLEAGTVKSGFIWTELGVFATDPDTQGDVLYMYGYAGAESDAVPAANEPTIIEKIINVTAIVASAENVTAIIDTSLVYLTQADLEEHNADPEANPAAIQAHNDNPNAHEDLFSQKADLGEDGKIPDAQLPDMDYVARTGDTMTGNLTMSNGATVTGLPTPSGNADAVPKSFLTAQLAKYLALSGGTMTGAINMNSKKITNLPTPSAAKDAVTKDYVDSLLSGIFVLGTYIGTAEYVSSEGNYPNPSQKINLSKTPRFVMVWTNIPFAVTNVGSGSETSISFGFAYKDGVSSSGITISANGFSVTCNGYRPSSGTKLNVKDTKYSYLAYF